MKIHTLDELEDALYADFAWRRDELRAMERSLTPARVSDMRARVRAGIALVYAHWEGGVKTMGERYLSYIKNQRARYQELADGLLGLVLKGQLHEIEHSTRFQRNRQVCGEVFGNLGEHAKFPASATINTGSNLGSDRLVDILSSLSLDESLFASKHVLIDALLEVRNDIAHGAAVIVVKNDFHRFMEPIETALEVFRDTLIGAANHRDYMRPAPAAKV